MPTPNHSYLGGISNINKNHLYEEYSFGILDADLPSYTSASKAILLTNLFKLSTQKTTHLFNPETCTNQKIFNFFSKSPNQTEGDEFYVVNHSDVGDETRILKKSTGRPQPVRCIKYPVQDNNTSVELIRFRFNICESNIQHKPISNSTFLTLKQKRYNVRNKINTLKFTSSVGDKKYQYSGNPFLKNTSVVEENFSNPTRLEIGYCVQKEF